MIKKIDSYSIYEKFQDNPGQFQTFYKIPGHSRAFQDTFLIPGHSRTVATMFITVKSTEHEQFHVSSGQSCLQ